VAPGAKAPPAPILLGPVTRERACRVLEHQLGAVWAAVLESHGFDAAQGFRLTIEGLGLAPGPPEPATNGRTSDADQ
jgi:hypothetical protein